MIYKISIEVIINDESYGAIHVCDCQSNEIALLVLSALVSSIEAKEMVPLELRRMDGYEKSYLVLESHDTSFEVPEVDEILRLVVP